MPGSPKNNRLPVRLLRHHLPLATACILSFVALYFTRPGNWDWVIRSSFSTAYPALVLLTVTLLIGPWNLVRRRGNPVSSDLRRDIGIWAGIMSVAHAVVGQCVHLRGRPWLYYIYGPKEHHSLPGLPLRHNLFGWANYTGLAATLLVIALLATSNDVMLRRMGTPGWKKLQRWNYAVFALVAFHTFAYQRGIEKQRLDFVLSGVVCVAVTLVMQGAGAMARRRRDAERQRAIA
jgi:sulfoxide reductase heme-binding subunit YedZ